MNPDTRSLNDVALPFRQPAVDEGVFGVSLMGDSVESRSPRELLCVLVAQSMCQMDAQRTVDCLIEHFESISALFEAELSHIQSILHDATSARCIHTILVTSKLLMRQMMLEDIKEKPVISRWTALTEYLKFLLRTKSIEELHVLFLDRKNRLIKDECCQRGTVDHTPLYPREIVKRALELAASAVILAHNHPSGDPTPSKADIDMTKQVIRALDSVDIQVHDHVIVGRNDFLSFRAQRLI